MKKRGRKARETVFSLVMPRETSDNVCHNEIEEEPRDARSVPEDDCPSASAVSHAALYFASGIPDHVAQEKYSGGPFPLCGKSLAEPLGQRYEEIPDQ